MSLASGIETVDTMSLEAVTDARLSARAALTPWPPLVATGEAGRGCSSEVRRRAAEMEPAKELVKELIQAASPPEPRPSMAARLLAMRSLFCRNVPFPFWFSVSVASIWWIAGSPPGPLCAASWSMLAPRARHVWSSSLPSRCLSAREMMSPNSSRRCRSPACTYSKVAGKTSCLCFTRWSRTAVRSAHSSPRRALQRRS
mmetsp:Transcript_5056/g.11837  ORF Transcript_5056/g.11837 Transcript_5056/m.11837 type:complete len:200 (+) Transcript_5056:119-718(+)